MPPIRFHVRFPPRLRSPRRARSGSPPKAAQNPRRSPSDEFRRAAQAAAPTTLPLSQKQTSDFSLRASFFPRASFPRAPEHTTLPSRPPVPGDAANPHKSNLRRAPRQDWPLRSPADFRFPEWSLPEIQQVRSRSASSLPLFNSNEIPEVSSD